MFIRNQSIHICAPACACCCSKGTAWGSRMSARCSRFSMLSIVMFGLRSHKRHGFMPTFSCLPNFIQSGYSSSLGIEWVREVEAMTPERHFIHLAGTEGHWVTPDFDPIVIYSHFMSG